MIIVALLDIYTLLQTLMRVFFWLKYVKLTHFFHFASFDAIALTPHSY